MFLPSKAGVPLSCVLVISGGWAWLPDEALPWWEASRRPGSWSPLGPAPGAFLSRLCPCSPPGLLSPSPSPLAFGLGHCVTAQALPSQTALSCSVCISVAV